MWRPCAAIGARGIFVFKRPLFPHGAAGAVAAASHDNRSRTRRRRRARPFSTTNTTADRTTQGLFGVASLRRPEDFLKLAHESVERCEVLKRGLVNGEVQPGVETIRDLDAISNTLCIAIDAAELARNVHYEAAWREAAEEAFAGLSGYIHELNTDVGLYQAVRTVVDDPLLAKSLNEEEMCTAKLLKAEFESSGIHLPEAERHEVRALLNELTGLETIFSNNLILKRRTFQVNKADLLAHMPSEVVNSVILPHQPLGQPAHLLTLSTDTAVANAVLRYARDEGLRKRMYLEVNTSPTENLEVLARLIHGRDALARKLGFPSYAHRFLVDKMAKRPEQVEAFLLALADKVRAKADEELNVLQQAKRGQEGNLDEEFYHWDLSYYMGAVKSARHAVVDHQGMAAYLSLDNCLHGLALLCQRLFGITLKRVPMDSTEMWAPPEADLQKLILVHPTEGELGTIYLDLYPRPAKYTHHAQFTVRCGCLPKGASQYQLPIVALVCNFGSSTGGSTKSGRPVLLSHAELEALFHEFGHALHSLLSRTRFQHVAGTRAPVDFVETPSHLLEYFAWDQRVLQEFAHHYETGKPIPAELTTTLRASKTEFAGLDTQIQILYSLVDQRLFGPQPLAHNPVSSEFLAAVQTQVMSLPHSEGTLWHARFGHLTGYGAGYYGYLYDRVFASHLWQRLFAADPLNRRAGEALWKGLLVHGGAKDPHAILKAVLGEEPALDSFLAELQMPSK